MSQNHIHGSLLTILVRSGQNCEAFAKLYPLILDHSPIPDSRTGSSVTLPADLPNPYLLIIDLNVAPGCSQSAFELEQSRQLTSSTKLVWIPWSASAADWLYFRDTPFGLNNKKAWEAADEGRDLSEAYVELCDSHNVDYR